MRIDKTDPLAAPIPVETLTRLRHVIEGEVAPMAFEELRPYLAGPAGAIAYRVTGDSRTDVAGRQIKRLKCIISGWFLLWDADGHSPEAFPVEIDSTLILVGSETELPPLDEEAEDEDTIVCGSHIDLKAQLQEELLLALPADVLRTTPAGQVSGPSGPPRHVGRAAGATGEASNASPGASGSPFAKLAALKKTS